MSQEHSREPPRESEEGSSSQATSSQTWQESDVDLYVSFEACRIYAEAFKMDSEDNKTALLLVLEMLKHYDVSEDEGLQIFFVVFNAEMAKLRGEPIYNYEAKKLQICEKHDIRFDTLETIEIAVKTRIVLNYSVYHEAPPMRTKQELENKLERGIIQFYLKTSSTVTVTYNLIDLENKLVVYAQSRTMEILHEENDTFNHEYYWSLSEGQNLFMEMNTNVYQKMQNLGSYVASNVVPEYKIDYENVTNHVYGIYRTPEQIAASKKRRAEGASKAVEWHLKRKAAKLQRIAARERAALLERKKRSTSCPAPFNKNTSFTMKSKSEQNIQVFIN